MPERTAPPPPDPLAVATEGPTPPPEGGSVPRRRRGLSPAIWVPAMIALVLAMLVAVARL